MGLQQRAVERLLGYGRLHLLVRPPGDLGEDVFLRYELSRLPDACALTAAISTAAGFADGPVTTGHNNVLRA